jgi:hypothetical protein
MTKPKADTPKEPSAMSIAMVQSRAVRLYLESIQAVPVPRRGPRRRTAEDLQQALVEATDPIERLKLRPLLREAQAEESSDNSSLVRAFIEHCASYSERHGLIYADWREEGVPASVLKEAGVKR